jgi:hypothetical protein
MDQSDARGEALLANREQRLGIRQRDGLGADHGGIGHRSSLVLVQRETHGLAGGLDCLLRYPGLLFEDAQRR